MGVMSLKGRHYQRPRKTVDSSADSSDGCESTCAGNRAPPRTRASMHTHPKATSKSQNNTPPHTLSSTKPIRKTLPKSGGVLSDQSNRSSRNLSDYKYESTDQPPRQFPVPKRPSSPMADSKLSHSALAAFVEDIGATIGQFLSQLIGTALANLQNAKRFQEESICESIPSALMSDEEDESDGRLLSPPRIKVEVNEADAGEWGHWADFQDDLAMKSMLRVSTTSLGRNQGEVLLGIVREGDEENDGDESLLF